MDENNNQVPDTQEQPTFEQPQFDQPVYEQPPAYYCLLSTSRCI